MDEQDWKKYTKSFDGQRNQAGKDRLFSQSPPPKPKPHFSQLAQQHSLEESLQTIDFSLLENGETLTWHRAGIQKSVVRKLRRGGYSVQAELDLHGYNQTQAKNALSDFLKRAHLARLSCVRIIHGKGNHSEHGPILKRALAGWLVKRDSVLAFASAPSHDGGTGAVYVLLKTR